jgi:hypothetical protein
MGNGAILISEVGERASDEFVAATFSSAFAPDFSLKPASESLFVPRGSQVTDVMTMAPVFKVP